MLRNTARLTAAGIAAVAAMSLSCGPAPPIAPSMATLIPAGATIVGGINLERVRATPLAQHLPQTASAFLEPLREVNKVLIASDGASFLVVDQGTFRQPPSGTTPIAPGLAAAGTPGWVRAAAASQHPQAASSALLPYAETAAVSGDIWLVAAGAANFPLTGNSQNIAALIHATRYTTLTAKLGDTIAIEVLGMCASQETARQLEETVRADLSLGAGLSRQPAVAGLLRRAQVSREDRAVHLKVALRANELEGFFGLF